MVTEKELFNSTETPLIKAINLVEASAGTGKTYAIAMLVLRLIAEKDISIDQILLVTFTRAATQELGHRIRTRLVEARNGLTHTDRCDDETLKYWADGISNRREVLERIDRALMDIDRASIFTIHGFCQKILRELPLESGQLSDIELCPDPQFMAEEISRDFWRKFIYNLQPVLSGLVFSEYGSPDKLYSAIRPLSGHFTSIEPSTLPDEDAADMVESAYAELREWWQGCKTVLFDSLFTIYSEGKMKKSVDFPLLWSELDEYFSGDKHTIPKGFDLLEREKLINCLNGNKLRGNKKQDLVDTLHLPGKQIDTFFSGCRSFLLYIRLKFADYVVKEMEERMVRKNLISYNDIILRMYKAINNRQNQSLQTILGQRFKAALIDEFQDTDHMQWSIFNSLFGQKQHYFYLIGDPKQAIYSFRGADIYSYFSARNTSSKILTLEKNYRSHPGAVKSVNKLFTQRIDSFGYEKSMIHYQDVKAGLAEGEIDLRRYGKSAVNFVYCQLPPYDDARDGRWKSGQAANSIRQMIVAEIQKLLNGDWTYFNNGKEDIISPSDIAILVRKNSEGKQYLEALNSSGIKAVLQYRDSIYNTEECRELISIAEAIANPVDTRLVKRALSSPWFGRNGNDIYDFFQDDDQFDEALNRLNMYGELWRRRGFIEMITTFLNGENVFYHIGAGLSGERMITNINHLIEIIGTSEVENLDQPQIILKILKAKWEEHASEEVLRLESDEEAVKIVTLHGSKGLEYPIVFCPSLWYRYNWLEQEKGRVVASENDGTILDLGSEAFEIRKQKAIREQKCEDLRLLYVAITRAKLRCYLFWGDISIGGKGGGDSFDSSLGNLLFSSKKMDFANQERKLKGLVDDSSEYRVVFGEPTGKVSIENQLARINYTCRKSGRTSFSSDFQLTSYSALAHGSYQQPTGVGSIENIKSDESIKPLEYHLLPSGPNFGNVVHDILEEIPFKELLNAHQHREIIKKTCRNYGVDPDMNLMEKLLTTIVSTPLVVEHGDAKKQFSLSELNLEKCLRELGFYFRLEETNTIDINAILSDEPTYSDLSRKNIQGYLTGFIDLVFQHEEMFYILDYKTNNLGQYEKYYTNTALNDAMRSHNYGLQCWIYSLVLHKHLLNFLPGYSHQENFGGVFYLFVRGMGKGKNGIFFLRPSHEKLTLLNQCLGGMDG